MTKPTFLFACSIADEDAKARMERHVSIVELTEATEQAILDHVEGADGVIVPFTKDVVITRRVIDRGSSLRLVGTT
ncbi:MAG: glyoxylate reductase, partial [Patescibacteria group bacterium]|nr:glyoxylate reductase [Patescibacteria group bacterium]